MGFGILALGTLIALLPEQAFSFAAAKVPAPATTAMLILMLVLAARLPVAHRQLTWIRQRRPG